MVALREAAYYPNPCFLNDPPRCIIAALYSLSYLTVKLITITNSAFGPPSVHLISFLFPRCITNPLWATLMGRDKIIMGRLINIMFYLHINSFNIFYLSQQGSGLYINNSCLDIETLMNGIGSITLVIL